MAKHNEYQQLMSDSSLQLIYRKISQSVLVLLAVLIIVCGWIFFSANQQAHQEQNYREKYRYQRALITLNLLLEPMLAVDNIATLPKDHQALIAQWQTLLSVMPKPQALSDEWLLINKKHQALLAGIALSYDKQIQLKKNALTQLELISQTLENLAYRKQTQQQKRQYFISDPQANISQVVQQARLYVQQAPELLHNIQLKQHISDLLKRLSMLDLSSNLSDFSKIEQAFTTILTMSKMLIKEMSHTKNSAKLSEQVQHLKKLLLAEQGLLAKWHGHLLIIDDYRLSLINQHQQIQYVLAEENLTVIGRTDESTGNLDNGEFVPLWWQYVFLICGLSLFVFILSVQLKRQLRAYGQAHVAMLKDMILADEHQDISDYPSVIQSLKPLLNQFKTTEFIERDYQTKIKYLQYQLYLLAKVNNVAYWQLDETPWCANEQLRQILVNDADEKLTSWRRLFSAQSVQLLLDAARIVKTEQIIQEVRVTTLVGQALLIIICYQEQQWFGTLADEQYAIKLQQDSLALADEINEQQLQYQKSNLRKFDQLEVMITDAMLVNQRNKGQGSSFNLQVYQQKALFLSWIEQQKIRDLLANKARLILSDVALEDEIYSTVLNVMSDIQLDNNRIIVSCDEQLMTKAKLDIQLFQQLITMFCRLLLSGQKGVQLHFSVQVIDKNVGQQIIKLVGQVNKVKQQVLPYWFDLLTGEQDNFVIDSSEEIAYFQQLLLTLHGRDMLTAVTDSGYILSMELPIAIADEQRKTLNEISLAPLTCVLISANETLQELVTGYVHEVGGAVDVIVNANLLVEQWQAKSANAQAINVILLAADAYQENFIQVSEYIKSFPSQLQPKLMVMQDPYQDNLHRQGFYSQATSPFGEASFLTELSELIQSSKTSNLIFDTALCAKHQYLSSTVEVLFAVSVVQSQQKLLRLLYYFGLKVRVVSDEKLMQQLWQSGRYMILVTEFNQLPFVSLSFESNHLRGVFSFSPWQTGQLSVTEQKIMQQWRVDVLPDDFDLDKLVSLFKPWLHTMGESLDASVTSADVLPQLDFSLSSVNGLTPAAFNMPLYIEHQGSAELAIYMLDEYVKSNQQYLTLLSNAINQENLVFAQQALVTLTQNAKILAADEMISLCVLLDEALVEKNFSQAGQVLRDTENVFYAIELYVEDM